MRLTQVSKPVPKVVYNVCHDTGAFFQCGMSGQEETVYTESLNKLLNFPS